VQFTIGKSAALEQEKVDIGVFLVGSGVDCFARVECFREAEEGDNECAELDIALVIISVGEWY
jgi:hypothetical protein